MKFLNQDRLVQILAEWPLLRMLVFDFWFRLAALALVLLFVFLGLFLPPIWRTSPKGFKPVIYVSGLYLVQAWSLKRTAMEAAAAGRFEESSYAWQSAIHHNPADPTLLRGALSVALEMQLTPRIASLGMNYCPWLLRLTSTNLADLKLVSRIYERLRLPDLVLRGLEPFADSLPPDLEALYLKAFFNQGLIGHFVSRWEQKKGDGLPDPELPFYFAAYQAGWGPKETMLEGRQKLLEAAQTSPHRILVNRLLLTVSGHRREVEPYGDALQRLQDWKADQTYDHIGYWYLLAAYGQAQQAAHMAQDFEIAPVSAVETVRLAEVYKQLGLRDEALELLRNYIPQFDYTIIGWITYARFLIEAERWEDLRSIAMQIRQESAIHDMMTDYSYYLEGRAELGQGKTDAAENAFERAAQFEFVNPGLGFSAASDLTKLGYPHYAKQILERMEKSGANNPQYWILAARTAHELKQSDWMLGATMKAYQLNPKNVVIRNFYAASLLIRRENPAEAIRLTLESLTDNPAIIGLRLNHSLALLLNERLAEADKFLKTIDPNRLNPEEANAYYLAQFELNYRLHRHDAAQKFLSQIDRQHLFPDQIVWLDAAQQQMAASPQSGQ